MRRATPNFKVERRRSRISTQERKTSDMIDPPSPDDTPNVDVHADMDSIRRAEDVLFSKVSPIALRTLSDQSRAKLDTSFHPEEQPAPKVGRILPSLTTADLNEPHQVERIKKRQYNALSTKNEEHPADERQPRLFDALENRQPEAEPEVEAEAATVPPKPADDERVLTNADLPGLMGIKTFDPDEKKAADQEWQDAAPKEEPKKPLTLAEIASQLAPRVKSTPAQIEARLAERRQRIAAAKAETQPQPEPQVNLEALMADQPPIHDRAQRLLYNNWMRHNLKKDALAYPDLATRILRPGERWKQRLPFTLW